MGVGGQRHDSGVLPPEKRPGVHFTGGWVGLAAGLEKFHPHRISIPGPSSS